MFFFNWIFSTRIDWVGYHCNMCQRGWSVIWRSSGYDVAIRCSYVCQCPTTLGKGNFVRYRLFLSLSKNAPFHPKRNLPKGRKCDRSRYHYFGVCWKFSVSLLHLFRTQILGSNCAWWVCLANLSKTHSANGPTFELFGDQKYLRFER